MDKMPESSFADKPAFKELSIGVSGLVSDLVAEGDFACEEQVALTVANALVRVHLERRLQGIADGHGERLLVNGVEYGRHEPGEVEYHSLVGDLAVKRFTYRQTGVRNGPTVVPLELAAGLIERGTPALAYSVAQGYAKTDMRDYLEHMEGARREPPSRTTLERMAKAIGNKAAAAAPRIEPYLRQAERVPEEAVAVSFGLDRTTVPMEEERPDGQEPKTLRKKRTKPRVRVAPKPVDVHWRQAYIGTVTLHDAHGDALITRRYTALPSAEPDEVLRPIMADLRNALRWKPTLNVGVVQDGAPELWNATDRALQDEPSVREIQVYKLIDRYHLNERLGAALVLLEPDAAARTKQLSEWNHDLDVFTSAIDWIERQLLAHYSRLDEEAAAKLWEHLVYIRNNKHRMRYSQLADTGLPVGSGITEGACKSVIGQRTGGHSQRWREAGITAALRLRAIHRSSRLPAFWRHLARRYTAVVADAS